MRKLLLFTSLCFCIVHCYAREYDVCVYGGTASGVVAAYSAARMGASVILVEPDVTLGV